MRLDKTFLAASCLLALTGIAQGGAPEGDPLSEPARNAQEVNAYPRLCVSKLRVGHAGEIGPFMLDYVRYHNCTELTEVTGNRRFICEMPAKNSERKKR